jgi:sugar phosphate isomerase/epimerase
LSEQTDGGSLHIVPGIFGTILQRPTLEESLDAHVAAGLKTFQFDYAMVGEPSMPEHIAPETNEHVRTAVAERGLTIANVEGIYNMSHPDPEVRAAGGARLAEMIRSAPAIGTHLVTLCTGSRADNMWKLHPDSLTPEAWRDLLESITAAVAVAEEHDVVLGVECEWNNVMQTAPRGRKLLDEVGSPSLKIILDAANLIPPGELDRQEELLREGFELLGEDIAVAHAKDITAEGKFVPVSKGGLDYDLFMDLLREHRYEGAMILHSLDESELPECLSFVRSHLDKIGALS